MLASASTEDGSEPGWLLRSCEVPGSQITLDGVQQLDTRAQYQWLSLQRPSCLWYCCCLKFILSQKCRCVLIISLLEVKAFCIYWPDDIFGILNRLFATWFNCCLEWLSSESSPMSPVFLLWEKWKFSCGLTWNSCWSESQVFAAPHIFGAHHDGDTHWEFHQDL